MTKGRILVVGELNQVGGIISTLLIGKDFDLNVVEARFRIEKIRAELSRKKYDLVLITNNGLSPSHIQALIPEIKKKYPGIKIIVLSGCNTPKFVRDVMEQGIDDLLPLPFDLEDLIQTVISIFDEENKIVKEAQKKLNWATLSFRENFRGRVIGYDRYNYRVSFIHRGRRFAIESIPGKEIDDIKMGVNNSIYLKELLGWLAESHPQASILKNFQETVKKCLH